MIHSDQELEVIQERIVSFQRLLAQLRITAAPDEFPLVAGGYRAEIEKMQAEVMSYLMHHASEPAPALAA